MIVNGKCIRRFCITNDKKFSTLNSDDKSTTFLHGFIESAQWLRIVSCIKNLALFCASRWFHCCVSPPHIKAKDIFQTIFQTFSRSSPNKKPLKKARAPPRSSLLDFISHSPFPPPSSFESRLCESTRESRNKTEPAAQSSWKNKRSTSVQEFQSRLDVAGLWTIFLSLTLGTRLFGLGNSIWRVYETFSQLISR